MIIRAINWCVPAKLRSDPDSYRKAKGLVIISIAIFPWWLQFGRMYHNLRISGFIVAVIASFGAVVAGVPLILRFSKSLVFSVNVFAWAIFSTLSVNAFRDAGLYSQSLLTLSLIPLMAICLANVLSGVLWTVVILAELGVLFYLETQGHPIPRITPANGIALLWVNGLVASVSVTALVAAYYERMRNNLYAMVLSRARDLENKNQLILSQQKQLVMSSKMAALGEMAAGVAHEFNNPLAVILMLSSQLERIVANDPVDRDQLSEMTSKIISTTRRIAKIATGLLAFSRDGRHDPFQVIRFRSLIDDTLAFCAERFVSHGVSLTTDLVADDIHFEGRSVEISQVLLNILNNALDATAGADLKWVKLAALDQGEWVEIRVTDSGNGVPTEIRDKLFQPFFTTKEVGKGTGMGLSISLGIVHGHHGELKLDALSPHTCFVIRLPKHQTRAVLGGAA